jgi:pentatricopeptide repeat protein
MDAALLRLPLVDFIDYRDERMVRTVDAIREDLVDHGLVRRYPLGLGDGAGEEGEDEGVFIACSFWLAECLARQGRWEAALEAFDRAIETGNDLMLFSEEYDPRKGIMLGNFPQGLTHLSLVAAAATLEELKGDR